MCAHMAGKIMAEGTRTQHDIGDLVKAQRGIESEKITERKKWASTLRTLLDSAYIVEYIDSTEARTKGRGSSISWTTLLRSVVGYVSRECDVISKMEEKGAQSSTAYSNRQTRKKDVGDMFRAYVRAANKRGPHLIIGDVLDHVISVLENKKMGVWLCMDYSQTLLHYILPVPHYILQMSSQYWEALLLLYCQLFLSPHPSFDRTLLSRIIHTLISLSSSQCDIPADKLYFFFIQAFANINQEKNSKVLEHLLTSLNEFSAVVAVNARGRLCKLGEEIFCHMLHLWSKCQPAVRDQIVEFLRIQLCIHHPRGTHTDEEGAWATNDALWKRNLERLFDQILSDFELASHRLRWTGKTESSQKPELIDLASDTIQQVMYLRDGRDASLSADLAPPRGKKRKVQSTWSMLRDHLTSNQDSPAVVLWLQLLSWLLSKWPSSLPPEESTPLLAQLHKVQAEAKRPECVRWLFACLHVLAVNPYTATALNRTARDLWHQVWFGALKTVSVHTAEEEGYALLTTLIEQHLVECDLEPWKLLNAAVNLPTRPAVSFLSSILRHQSLPESLHPSLTTPTATPTNCYPLRSQLLQFLLAASEVRGGVRGGDGAHLDGSANGHSAGRVKLANRPHVVVMAHALVALTQRSCGSAHLPFLKRLYHCDSPAAYVREMLDSTGSLEDLERRWTPIEQTYLESTFDAPLSLTFMDREKGQPIVLSRENTIGVLQTLLLDLLAKRAEVLLQPVDTESCPTPRERAQQLAALAECQAYHSCLLMHVLLLLCHCEAFTHVDQLRRTPAIRSLPELLKGISVTLKDAVWNHVEKPVYYLTTKTVLGTLCPLVCFSHLEGSQLSPSISKALQVVRKVCALSLPAELLDTASKLVQGKWPPPTLPLAPSISSSAFSLGGSSCPNSRPQSVADSCGSSPTFDDEMDLGMTDSGPSVQSEPTSINLTGPTDILSSNTLNEKTAARLEASVFLCRLYSAVVATPGGTGGSDGTDPQWVGGAFDIQKLLLSMLSEESLDLTKPVYIQMVFKICESLTSSCSDDLLGVEMLDGLMEVLGKVLNVHRKNQHVYRESLRILTLLVPHLRSTTEDSTARDHCRLILSVFWNLYCEGKLHAPVRVELARFIQACFEVDRNDQWTTITIKRKRKKESIEETLSLREALVAMVNDTHHAVRMHMAKVVPYLYLRDQSSLLPRADQEETFQQVSNMLQKAHMVVTSQDELSAEDDSVNRHASMITTLQYEACSSPVCERRVMSVLTTAVGHGHIDDDLVSKALGQIARYLGYSSTRAFLEAMLVFLFSSWLKDGFPVIDFPYKLLSFSSKEDFFRNYTHLILPHLVYLADESSLTSLSDLLHTPLPDLLQPSLPACMALILTSYAQQSSGDSEEEGGERRAQATTSHNLLTRHLTDEVVSQAVKYSIDEFVVELLVRMCEPHTANTHLAKYCRPSDPEPCSPHYTSLAIRATLDYMPSCYGSTAVGTSFVRLLSKRKDNIQKILLSLTLKIESTHRPFEKRRLFLAYSLFISFVCKELQDGLEGTQPFVVMDTVHTLVRILTKPEGKEREGTLRELFAPCCDILLTLCEATLKACPKELRKHLHTIVTTLVPFAQQQTTEGKQALAVLNFLILDAELLAEHIALLDPFPTAEPFSKLCRKQAELKEITGAVSLSEEIDRFLSIGQDCPHSSRREGLRSLQALLHASLLDVSSLIQRGSNSVASLIQGLIDLCQDPADGGGGVCGEVGRCLGEIGPTDLRCIAIPTTGDTQSSFDPSTLPSGWSDSMRCTAMILYKLTTLLSDKDVQVVQASGECLRAVLATKIGGQVLGKVEEMCLENEWHLYLEPFKPQRRKKGSSSTSQPPSLPPATSFPILVDVPELWLPSNWSSHREWVTQLVTTIISSGGVTDEVLLLLKPVCQVQVGLCEEVFPLLIRDILSTDRGDFHAIISRQIRLFFSTVSSAPRPSSPSTSAHYTFHTHPDSIRTMLNMVMYLRTVDRPKKTRGTVTPWDNNFWLDLDFLDVAKAAQLCSAYFTSLLYIEIWHGTTRTVSQNGFGFDSSGGDDPEAMDVGSTRHPSLSNQASTLDDPNVQRLLMEAYSRIGEPDSIYGACAAHSSSETTRVRMYEHEGQWQKSLSAYNLQMQLPGTSSQSSLVESLHNLGLTHILHMYLLGMSVEDPHCMRDVAEYHYETAWRCSMWENTEMSSLQTVDSQGGYHQSVYSCLTALKDGESNLLQSSLVDARSKVISSLCSSGLESAYSLYPSLSKLLCLLEIEEAGSESTSPTAADLTYLSDWKNRLPYMDSDFQFVEPVLTLRSSILHSLLRRTAMECGREASPPVSLRRRVERLFAALTNTLLTQARLAREAGSYQVAEGALFSLKYLSSQRSAYDIPGSLHPSLPYTHHLEEAKLRWERKETTFAIGLLKNLLQTFSGPNQPPPEVASLYPATLSLYGSWLAETHSESPTVIMDTYLEKSVNLMEELNSHDQPAMIRAYLTLARYADTQYQRITRHMSSPAFEAKRQLLQKSKHELQHLVSHLSAEARQRSRHVRTLQAQILEDDIAVSSLLDDKQRFLEKALKNYILCLRTGDEHDLRVFRLCALWFANCSNSNVNTIIKDGASQLQSRKFLPLMYQLAARISTRTLANDPFQQTLQQMIHSTTLDHPYHCLYVILALSNASMDDKYPSSGHVTGTKVPSGGTGVRSRLTKKSSTSGTSTVDEDKVKAAVGLIVKLRSEKPTLVSAMEELCGAYIDLAYHDVTAYRKQRGPIKLPSSCPLTKLTRMREVAMPTMEIEVDPTCRYDNITYIEGFDSCFQLAGGVNLPKVLSCSGSDGKRRRQLVKGKDDLRQDAVMQQVFVLVNRLLRREPATCKRRLSVRTYKVIPLSQRSGIVEWCEGTRPLGEYLIGTPQNPYQSAHYRYRSSDLSSMECRKRLMSAGNDKRGSKYQCYKEICDRFQPVFHHFFMEQYPSPSEWFERRLAYTRSVAASSIVGYIVGLGDRHVQNILIDTNTAEFIHIDLGVAFEQGKTLPTPETVPFRLTRDLVDGMGIAGVEGVFRRCCEETMVVMKASHEELRTIVEVLLYDPLYLWTISPLKALNLQRRADADETNASTTGGGEIFEGDQTTSGTGNGNSSTNKMAERVLLRLQEKLEGIEDGVPLSVSGQVNNLIQEATDPANLCVLFPGWQPWI